METIEKQRYRSNVKNPDISYIKQGYRSICKVKHKSKVQIKKSEKNRGTDHSNGYATIKKETKARQRSRKRRKQGVQIIDLYLCFSSKT